MTSSGVSRRHVVLFPYVGGTGNIGGSHISSLKLVRALRDHPRYRPIIGLHRGDGPMADLVARMGLCHEVLPVRGMVEQDRWRASTTGPLGRARDALRYMGRTFPDMVRFLRAHDVRIVHTNDGRMHSNWAPAVTAARCSLVWHHRAEPTAKGVNYIAPLVADRIVTVSHFAKPAHPVRRVDHKVRVIYSPFDTPPPIDRSAARAQLLDELSCHPDTRLVGIVGSLVARKRPVDIVDVVAQLRGGDVAPPVMGLVFGTALPNGPNSTRPSPSAPLRSACRISSG